MSGLQLLDGSVIEVYTPDTDVTVSPPTDTVDVTNAPNVTIVGDVHTVLEQTVPAATWTIPNPTGRLCVVTLYVAGEVADTDIHVDAAWIVVTFATPTSGVLVVG